VPTCGVGRLLGSQICNPRIHVSRSGVILACCLEDLARQTLGIDCLSVGDLSRRDEGLRLCRVGLSMGRLYCGIFALGSAKCL
jgi:hypothetical protein